MLYAIQLNNYSIATVHVGKPQNSETFLLAIHLFVKCYHRFTAEYMCILLSQ